jgi:hypothetical protein
MSAGIIAFAVLDFTVDFGGKVLPMLLFVQLFLLGTKVKPKPVPRDLGPIERKLD